MLVLLALRWISISVTTLYSRLTLTISPDENLLSLSSSNISSDDEHSNENDDDYSNEYDDEHSNDDYSIDDKHEYEYDNDNDLEQALYVSCKWVTMFCCK